MPDSKLKLDNLPQRLCSEIQLFDLCNLDSCHHKSGRFCTNTVLLGSFEKIAEEDIRVPERSVFEDIDYGDEDDEDDALESYEDDEVDYMDDAE
jgi:hypothetical protein